MAEMHKVLRMDGDIWRFAPGPDHLYSATPLAQEDVAARLAGIASLVQPPLTVEELLARLNEGETIEYTVPDGDKPD